VLSRHDPVMAEMAATFAPKTVQWDYTLAKAFMQSVPESGRDAFAQAYRSLPSVADDARRFAARALRGAEDDKPYRTLGLVIGPHVDEIESLIGKNVAGFDFALDSHAVRHINKSHGDQAAEAKRGQRAVTAEDYEMLPLILNSPDTIEDGGKTDAGTPVVRIAKDIFGELYVAAFEVRKGRKMLALQSMWVRPGAPSR